jgi:hypothetical protein
MFRKGSIKFLLLAVKGVRAQQLLRKEGCSVPALWTQSKAGGSLGCSVREGRGGMESRWKRFGSDPDVEICELHAASLWSSSTDWNWYWIDTDVSKSSQIIQPQLDALVLQFYVEEQWNTTDEFSNIVQCTFSYLNSVPKNSSTAVLKQLLHSYVSCYRTLRQAC